MIPVIVTEVHVTEAIQLVVRDGLPPKIKGARYCLVCDGLHLPPKYTISLAHQVATGERLRLDRFSGGRESNEFLRHRGFHVIECDCGSGTHNESVLPLPRPKARRKRTNGSTSHDERCAECKTRVAELLKSVYGGCVRNHRFGWHTGLTLDYEASTVGSLLRDVAGSLEGHRGFSFDEFARSRVLAGCDYWVPDPGFIVEFDESQHFTFPRKLALSAYGDSVSLGFSARRWIGLCEHHDKRDHRPPYRDEQRAWYDTLRDLLPLVKGLQPTVRLYARDLAWCSLDPDSRESREQFKALLRG